MKLNVGCGDDYLEGYVNVDVDERVRADVHCLAWELPYDDGIVDEILASHVIEHFVEPDRDEALAEWWRVLKSGGLLTVRCPNMVVYVEEWLLASDFETRWGWPLRAIFGWQDRGPGQLHHTGYDLLRLCEVLQAAGFIVRTAEVVSTRYRRGPQHRPDGDLLCVCVK